MLATLGRGTDKVPAAHERLKVWMNGRAWNRVKTARQTAHNAAHKQVHKQDHKQDQKRHIKAEFIPRHQETRR